MIGTTSADSTRPTVASTWVSDQIIRQYIGGPVGFGSCISHACRGAVSVWKDWNLLDGMRLTTFLLSSCFESKGASGGNYHACVDLVLLSL